MLTAPMTVAISAAIVALGVAFQRSQLNSAPGYTLAFTCGIGKTTQICYRVTNPSDMGIFPKWDPYLSLFIIKK